MPKSPYSARHSSVPLEVVGRRSYIFRGRKVMIDSDLAALYRVPTFRLNEAVKRNRDRFPVDFMFQLTVEEAVALHAHVPLARAGRHGRYALPLAFTELGVAMLASVLKSERAVELNIALLRELAAVPRRSPSRAGLEYAEMLRAG